jgi:uncharacterized Rmd1/YagE family protein
MRTFSCFSSDSRHAVPELAFIMARDESRAQEVARRTLIENPEILTVEVMENGRTIGVLRRDDAVGSNVRSLEHPRRAASARRAPAQRSRVSGMSPGAQEAPRTLAVHALLLGERLNTAGLEREGVIATVPLSFRVGDHGVAALFRYGAAVFIGADAGPQADTLRSLSDRISGPEQMPDEETATIVVRPGQEEQITPGGAIQLREASREHLLIVADVLAKSVALARDERRVSGVFDAIEPFATGLAAKGRSPGGGRRRGILRLIGEALLVQHRVSGRVAVREKPDILWDRPDLERLYSRLEDEYELIERAETLERKLAVIAASTTAFVDLQDTARAFRLEAIIVALILGELAVASFQLFGGLLR